MASGKKHDKFATTGLTPIKSDQVNAPYIEEFPFVLECKLLHTYEIGLHTQFIGEIVDVKVDETVMDENGNPDVEKVKPIIFAFASKTYHGIGAKIGDAWSIGKDLS
jgi:flavin reductase (DIM6/NTAB) family NADH-FMN oxidoreductase RutF